MTKLGRRESDCCILLISLELRGELAREVGSGGLLLFDVNRSLRRGSYEVLVHLRREAVVRGRRMAGGRVPHPGRGGPGEVGGVGRQGRHQLTLGRWRGDHLVVGGVVPAELHVPGGVAGGEIVVRVVGLGRPGHTHRGVLAVVGVV